MLCIDGTHLYGKYEGTLLVATGVDANDGIFPLAYAIVDSESKDSWDWFLRCMYYHIHSVRNRCLTFISDRMKGIPRALDNWPQEHHHRFCARHLKANFQVAERCLNDYFMKRRSDAEGFETQMSPKVETLLAKRAKQARSCSIVRFNQTEWQVNDQFEKAFTVTL